jgi:hypothetical protein
MMTRWLPRGKAPARPDAVKLKFRDYVDTSVLPTRPIIFGHENVVAATAWLMLGNDQLGDCVEAGAAHETMLYNGAVGVPVSFTTACTVKVYSEITGYTPKNPDSDQGTDMEVAANYRKKTGILDASGKRHKVGAYLALTPGDVEEHLLAAYLFGAVGIGIEFPESAMDQFNAGEPWDVVADSEIDGGHYIPLVAYRDMMVVVTWGQTQEMTEAFFVKYNDESIVYLSPEYFDGTGKTPEGFDIAQLTADLAAITGDPTPAPVPDPTPTPAPTPVPVPAPSVLQAIIQAFEDLAATIKDILSKL